MNRVMGNQGWRVGGETFLGASFLFGKEEVLASLGPVPGFLA